MKPVNHAQGVGYYPGSPAPTPSKPPRKPKRRRHRSHYNWPRLIMLAVCVGVFITCGILLINYFSNIAASRRASEELEAVYAAAQQATDAPSPTPTTDPTSTPSAAARQALPAATPSAVPTATPASLTEIWPTVYANNLAMRVSSAFYELQRKNADIVGWLKIDGVLEEAVVQRDNSYYLTHNVLKERSVTGALFLDENCNLRTVPTQMVIHGHNMKEGAMFGSLKKYKVKDASFYRSHPFVDFNTLYEQGRYVIFAVSEVDIRPGRVDHLAFWQYSRFPSVEIFNEYIEKARALSHYRCNVDVVPGDRILTLSTCTGTDDNKRLVVMARKIRDNEDEFALQTAILGTSDR